MPNPLPRAFGIATLVPQQLADGLSGWACCSTAELGWLFPCPDVSLRELLLGRAPGPSEFQRLVEAELAMALPGAGVAHGGEKYLTSTQRQGDGDVPVSAGAGEAARLAKPPTPRGRRERTGAVCPKLGLATPSH